MSEGESRGKSLRGTHNEVSGNAGGRNKGVSDGGFASGDMEAVSEIPSIELSSEVKNIFSEPYKDMIIIKVLGKNFSYTAITHKLKGVWRTKGGYEVLDVGLGISSSNILLKIWSVFSWVITGLNIWYYHEKLMMWIAALVGKQIRVDLATQSVALDICHRCNLKPETLDHCFHFCSKVNITRNSILFASALWWIWRDRNNDVFDSSNSWSIDKVLFLIRHSTADLVRFSSLLGSLNQHHVICNWSPPPLNTVKVNCDGTITEESILRCELFAIWRGLVLVWENDYRQVICETDSLECFLIIQSNNSAMNQEARDLQLKINEILHRDWTVLV
ncbi:hypothetical protein PIB30_054693 [Stylosanthes scabra]|uniref:RNase H type-1 domain-containing protein n=1 Tax=Stylosanthes scabra TaxID=79078 RepID=A0ABU6VIL8_9FABA|nr:hypothetical protein [Stylosanthes scabra]